MPWIKAWHVIFMVTWFAGLFYLPRLFVYHASATDAAGIERFRVMESRLFIIMTIGAVLTAAFGAWLLALNPGLLRHRAGCAPSSRSSRCSSAYHAWPGGSCATSPRGATRAARAGTGGSTRCRRCC